MSVKGRNCGIDGLLVGGGDLRLRGAEVGAQLRDGRGVVADCPGVVGYRRGVRCYQRCVRGDVFGILRYRRSVGGDVRRILGDVPLVCRGTVLQGGDGGAVVRDGGFIGLDEAFVLRYQTLAGVNVSRIRGNRPCVGGDVFRIRGYIGGVGAYPAGKGRHVGAEAVDLRLQVVNQGLVGVYLPREVGL